MSWVVAVCYGLAPGLGALIGFDFHEVALAVPLLAFSMAAMLRNDHRAAVLWALPLVLVKEDLPTQTSHGIGLSGTYAGAASGAKWRWRNLFSGGV